MFIMEVGGRGCVRGHELVLMCIPLGGGGGGLVVMFITLKGA